MKSVVMPMLALVMGVVSLFVDSKKSSAGRALALAGLSITAGLTIAINLQEGSARDAALRQSQEREKKTTEILLNITQKTEQIPDLVTMLRGWGYNSQNAETATVAEVSRSVDANRAYLGLLNARRNRQSPVRVEYFPKDVDGDKVIAAIKEAGLDVVQKRPVRDEATNAVWVGDNVPLDDAKLVGLALVRAGVDLVSIRRFRDGGGAKSNLIQIGADARLLGRPPLSSLDISSLTLLPKDTGLP
jgi:hypothetical protein